MNSLQYIQYVTKQISIYRPVQSYSLYKVKQFIVQEMKQIGLVTHEQHFTRTIHHTPYFFSNLIGINKQASPPYNILCAHLDSPPLSKCPSAIDAATSIAIILELTKKIIHNKPDIPLLLLFVDGEEAIDGDWADNNTLSGSTYFVKQINASIINKVYVFDLIGGDPIRNPIYAFRDHPHTWDDMKKLAIINKKYKPIIFISPEEKVIENSPLDDHIPFLLHHIYAMNLIPSTFPDTHHTKDDDYHHVNWKYVYTFFCILYEFLDHYI